MDSFVAPHHSFVKKVGVAGCSNMAFDSKDTDPKFVTSLISPALFFDYSLDLHESQSRFLIMLIGFCDFLNTIPYLVLCLTPQSESVSLV